MHLAETLLKEITMRMFNRRVILDVYNSYWTAWAPPIPQVKPGRRIRNGSRLVGASVYLHCQTAGVARPWRSDCVGTSGPTSRPYKIRTQ